jgi:hypothetical protein
MLLVLLQQPEELPKHLLVLSPKVHWHPKLQAHLQSLAVQQHLPTLHRQQELQVLHHVSDSLGEGEHMMMSWLDGLLSLLLLLLDLLPASLPPS